MLNAPAVECDRVNLRWSGPVQKRQQIFETVPVRHRSTSFSDKENAGTVARICSVVPSGQAPMPHGGVPNARSLTARDANRAIINVSAMRSSDSVRKDQVPFLQLCEAEPWSAPPAMPVGASSGCSPSSAAALATNTSPRALVGSSSACDPSPASRRTTASIVGRDVDRRLTVLHAIPTTAPIGRPRRRCRRRLGEVGRRL
jgi:hypothetical protein